MLSMKGYKSMGTEKARTESHRWLGTARGDLETARILLTNGRYAHACFHAQQAAEKAIKAVWFSIDGDPWGHSAQKLIEDLQALDYVLFGRFQRHIQAAAKLDRFYIPTRYPNGLPDLLPDAAFFREDAASAIEMSSVLLDETEKLLRS